MRKGSKHRPESIEKISRSKRTKGEEPSLAAQVDWARRAYLRLIMKQLEEAQKG